jgi:hypothetical protein
VPAGLWAAAGALGLLFAGEAVHGWLTFSRVQRGAGAEIVDDEEEEAE